ncbi:hypothetical protein [Streptomyces sp. NPDC005141]
MTRSFTVETAADLLVDLASDDEVLSSQSDWRATWTARTPSVAGTGVAMAASLFAQMTRTRHDIPFLRLAELDDTRLAALLLKVHVAFTACGVLYATQSSIGSDAALETEGRLRLVSTSEAVHPCKRDGRRNSS